jgi:hypothetical protein
MRVRSLLLIAAGAAMLLATTADARTGGAASGATGASAGAASGAASGGATGGGGLRAADVQPGPNPFPRHPQRVHFVRLPHRAHCGSEMAARDFYDYGYGYDDSYARFCLTEDPTAE